MTIFVLLFLASTFIIIPFGHADQYQNSTINISVDVSVPIARVSISPNSIDLGQTTKGYATIPKNITITNVGDLDVTVKPLLDNNANEIFQNLKFATASCSLWSNISNWESSTISNSPTYGGTGSQYNLCIKLDLTNYQSNISSELTPSTNLIFWVMPA